MSYEGILDKDLELKLLVSNYLWNLGYICRPCVNFYHYFKGKRTSRKYTDIDVLGLKFDSIGKPKIIVCSAKAGKESDPQQIFILSGIKQYFNAENAIYIREKSSTISVSEISKKLDITVLNKDELYRLGKNFNIDLNKVRYLNSKKCYEETCKMFLKLKEYDSAIYNYITEKYWIDRINLRILRIISCIKDIVKLKISENEKKFYIFYCVSLLLLPIIEIINKISNIPNSIFINALETKC